MAVCRFSTYANRRYCILDYYSAKKKNIFHVKETCVKRRRARVRSDAFRLSSAEGSTRPERRRRPLHIVF